MLKHTFDALVVLINALVRRTHDWRDVLVVVLLPGLILGALIAEPLFVLGGALFASAWLLNRSEPRPQSGFDRREGELPVSEAVGELVIVYGVAAVLFYGMLSFLLLAAIVYTAAWLFDLGFDPGQRTWELLARYAVPAVLIVSTVKWWRWLRSDRPSTWRGVGFLLSFFGGFSVCLGGVMRCSGPP